MKHFTVTEAGIERLTLGRARIVAGWTQRTSRGVDKDGNAAVCVDQAILGEMCDPSTEAYDEAAFWLTGVAYEILELETGRPYPAPEYIPHFGRLRAAGYQHINDRPWATKEFVIAMIDRAIEKAKGSRHQRHEERELELA